MAHWAFRVNLILVFTFSDYRGPIYMGSNVTPWVLQGWSAHNKEDYKYSHSKISDHSWCIWPQNKCFRFFMRKLLLYQLCIFRAKAI